MNKSGVIKKEENWLTSERRERLIKAADAAGKVFERRLKEQEDYELRELARTLRSA
jgi:hypothetical protein